MLRKNWSLCIISLYSGTIQLPSTITEHKTMYTNTNILTFIPGTATDWIPCEQPSGAGWHPLGLVALSPRSPPQWSRSPHPPSWKWWAPPCSTWQVLGGGCEWEADQLGWSPKGRWGTWRAEGRRGVQDRKQCAQLFISSYTGLHVSLRGGNGVGVGGLITMHSLWIQSTFIFTSHSPTLLHVARMYLM